MGEHDRRQKALLFALVLNGAYLVVEVAGGIVFGSLALLADAAHMVTDVAAITIAMVAQRLSQRPATARHTFGLQRTEALGAQANAVLLLAASVWISYEAVRRLAQPPEVAGAGLFVVASVGLLVNLVSVAVLTRAAGPSLNIRGVVLHLALDAAGSVAAIGAGVAVIVWDASWFDPLASLLIVVLVVVGAWRLLSDATSVLMEAAPRHLDTDEIEAFIASDAAVEGVHHVHVWNISSEVPALSAHVVIAGEPTLHEAQIQGDRLREAIRDRFGIAHTTFELECHGCG